MVSPHAGSLRNFVLIVLGNAILGAPMPMLIILGGLAGILLAPTAELATVLVSVQILAGLIAATPVSLFMGRYGRKTGFLAGATCAGLGGALGALSLFQSSFWGLCVAHAFLGAALASFGYFRFAAAEAVEESWRPTAISLTLTSGLFAAIIGPEIFIQTKDFFGPVQYAGAYAAISVIALIGVLPVAFLSLPASDPGGDQVEKPRVDLAATLRRRPVWVAIVCAAISFGTMTLLMTPTPIAMVGFGFSEDQASDVIRWHVVAMFAPGFFTGYLISRFGVTTIILVGLALLGVSAVIAIAGIQLVNFYISLIVLGLGWNFGFIGGTSLLADSISSKERPVVQGMNDTLIALASTLASFGSGAIVTSVSWTAVAVVSFPMLMIALAGLAMLRWRAAGV